MKVLMISTDRNIFREDSAVRARMIGYAKDYEELHIVIFNKKSGLETKISENLFVYSTNSVSKFLYIVDAVRLGKKILSSGNFQLTCQDPFETGLVGWWLAKKFKIPLELQIHTDLGSPYFTSSKLDWRLVVLNSLRLRLAKFLLPKADRIRVVSARIRSSLVSNLKIAENKIEIRPIKIDEEKIRNTVVSPENDLRKKYPQFNFIALMVGRLEPEKNFVLAIDAWREVIKKFPKAGLIIVGSGSKLKSLKSKVQSLKLENNIIFENWTENLVGYYKTADVFLNTSFYEGYGMAMVEAKAVGLSIISTDVGIARELDCDIIERNILDIAGKITNHIFTRH